MGLYRRLILWLGHKRWFAAIGRRYASRVDRVLYRASGGRLTTLGRKTVPVLLLTTTGRRSGSARTTPVMYIRDGAGYVVSSENFGQERPAAWPLNLDADPLASVEVDGARFACRARRLGDEEAERYWPRLVEAWPAHASYLARSGSRSMFLLSPE
jgi:deazaflavin-dependent oxidoreductase (nitroreductase family)